jgi:transcriptional regulator GlxA family with amidase domain
MVSFLCNNPHNYSAFLDNRVRPLASSQVRRAEEYILAYWDRPITIETLAQVTSASARSLFREFKRCWGQSPMAFVKQVRLQRAREMLESNDLTRSVTEAALACGFGNLGHFAGDYFKCFGERPSDTLERVRRQRGSKKIDLAA